MNRLSLLFAQIEPKELGSYWQQSNVSKAGLGTLIGAISVVTVAILIWAIFIRKPGRERPRSYHYPSPSNAESESRNGGNGSSGHHGRRRKRRRRSHRPRNPTLSETGGLPPVREDVPSDDPP